MYNDLNATLIQQIEINQMLNSDSNPYDYSSRNPYKSYTQPKENLDPPFDFDLLIEAEEVPKVTYKSTETKKIYDMFSKQIPEALLDCVCTVLKKEYIELYTQDKRYISLAKNLLFVLNEYSKDKTIKKDVYSKIKPIKDLFTKDPTRNYSAGNRSQGYTISPKLSKIITAITQQLALNTEVEKLPPSLDCILINKDLFKQASSEVQSYLLSKIQGEGEGENSENYFCFNTSDYITEGRSYNTFQQLPKAVKLITNTPYEVDMDSTAQSLMLSILAKYNTEYHKYTTDFLRYDSIRVKYPNVASYITSKAEKRSLTAHYTGKEEKWCKKLFTVPCYGGSSLLTEFNKIIKKKDDKHSFNHSTFVREYTKEISLLLNELNQLIEDRKLPQKVLNFIDVKTQDRIEKNNNKDKPKNMTKNWLKKGKVFFCIEYFEGYCRQTLKSELKKNTELGRTNELIFRDVHDAVYCNYLIEKHHIDKVQTELEAEGLFVKFSQSYG